MRLINVHGFFGRLIIAIATGYIWFFYSERVFWSFWREGRYIQSRRISVLF